MASEVPLVIQACAAVLQAQTKPERQAAEDAVGEALRTDPSAALFALITAVPEYQEVNKPLAQLCAIRAKNFVKNEMSEDTDLDLALVKSALLQAIPSASDSTRRLLVECARVVHAEEEWDDLLPLLMIQLSQASATKSHPASKQQCLSALQLLYVVTRQYKLSGVVPFDEQQETSSAFLPLLPPLFAFADLRISHMSLKIFESFVQQTTPIVLKDATLFNSWMNFMLQFAANERPECDLASDDYIMYVKCMKRIAAISYRMVQLAARKGSKRPKAAQHFVTNFGCAFADLWVAWLRFVAALDNDGRVAHAKTTVNCLRYLRECGVLEEVYPSLPIDELTTQLLFPLFPFNDDDEELWATDVNEYLRRLKDPMGDKTDMRHAATKAMLTFVDVKKPFQSPSHLPVLLQFVQAGLLEPPSRATDGYLHVLGMLHKVVKKVPGFAAAMQHVLVNNIAPLLQHENSVLRAKAIWICGLFAGIPFDDPSQFEAMLRAILSALDDPEAPVRMQVISSLASFMSLRKARPFLRETLTPLSRECIRLVDDNNSDFAVEALQALVEVFGPELSTQLYDICRSLIQRCRSVRFDLAHAMAAASNVNDMTDEGDASSEKLCFALESSLKAIVSCVEALGYDPQAIQNLQDPAFDLVLEVMGDGDVDLTDHALQIFDRLVYFAKSALKPKAWQVFEAMHQALMGGAVDLFSAYLPVLDNLCSHQPAEFTMPARLQMVEEMCAKMLSADVSCDTRCVASAAELMACMFQQLRPHRPALDAAAAGLLTLSLQSLITHESAEIRVGLCTVIMSAMYYDPAATLGVMDGLNATAFFLPNYCELLERQANVDKHLGTALGKKTHVIGICTYLDFALTSGSRGEAADVALRLLSLCAKLTKQNVVTYNGQLAALNRMLSGAAAEAAAEANGEDYESDDSMDVEEDEDDGNDGEAGDEEDDAPYASRFPTDEDDVEDELDVDSVLDNVCEVTMLNNTLAQCPSNVVQTFLAAWPAAPSELPAAQALSGQVISARQQVRASAATVHATRASAMS